MIQLWFSRDTDHLRCAVLAPDQEFGSGWPHAFYKDFPLRTPLSEHLPEDQFLDQFIGAMALESALRNGLIDALLAGGAMPQSRSATILATMLESSGVLGRGELTSAFRSVMQTRRDILEQKLLFLRLSAKDVTHRLDDLLGNLPSFMEHSETFALFRYDKAMQTDPKALSETRPWVNYVTALSKAEAPALVPHLPLKGARRLLEIGGNTGVIARAALDANEGLSAAILDLPAVCAIGQEIGPHPRLTFVPGDARKDDWPLVEGDWPDVIMFKSVLHDWPQDHAMAMLHRAMTHLAPNGRIIVCERGAFQSEHMPFWMTANLVFAPFYRPASDYQAALENKGMLDVSKADVALDMTFHIVSGRKP